MNKQSGKPMRSLPLLRRISAGITRRLAGTITGVRTDQPVVALTFDDGPNPDCTPQLLDLLARYNAKATFFVVGQAATRHPELIAKMASQGHVIGNHSWDHASFPMLSLAEGRKQIKTCAKALAPHGIKLFRPPYGHLDLRSRWVPWMLGYKVITWDVTGADWSGESAEQIVSNTLAQLHDGAIVLLHDQLFKSTDAALKDRTPTLQAVEQLLDQCCDRYQFVTVPDLLNFGRPKKRNWLMLPDEQWLRDKKLIGMDA